MTPAVSEEMVERAARAICTARCRNPDEMLGHIDDVDGKYPYWILFKPDAIAALSTLAPSAAPSDIPTAEQARERQRDIVRRNPEDFAEPYDPPSAEAAQPVAAMWRRRGKWKWFYRESPPPTDDTSWRPLYDEYAIAALSAPAPPQGELREGMVLVPRELTQALEAAIRAAKLALFVIRKQGVMPNSSWESGFDSDLKTAEAALSPKLGEEKR
jgi:hypothetical protein